MAVRTRMAMRTLDIEALPFRTLLAIVVVLATTACTSSTDLAVSSTTRPSGEGQSTAPLVPEEAVDLVCSAAIGHDVELPDTYTTLVDAVGLPTAESADQALQTDHRRDDPPPNHWAKTGLLVRADTRFTLTVDEPVGTALIGWGSPADFAPAITGDGCPGTGWLAFAGGFVVDQPRCIDLVVETAGAEERFQVGVGAPCAGQHPPPEL